MATVSEIQEVRISVNDPANIIQIIQVANLAALPAAPAPQAAYYTIDTARYYVTEKTSGAVPADYSYAELNISDARIGTIIDNLGSADKAKCRILSILAGVLGNQLRLIRTTSGSESAEYVRILEMYQYYKGLAADCKDAYEADNNTNTGTVRTMKQPEIGGGNL